MTQDEQIKAQIKAMKKKMKEINGDPEKSRQRLIELGILEKSGKRLAKKYR